MASLTHVALQNTHLAFRPDPQNSVNSLFLAFTIFVHVSHSYLTPVVLVSDMQLSHSNHISPSAMAKHMPAIKANLVLYGLPTQRYLDTSIKHFHKAMVLWSPFKVSLKKIIDIETLHLIVRTSDCICMDQVFKALYTLPFFSFLSLLNLVPHSSKLCSLLPIS